MNLSLHRLPAWTAVVVAFASSALLLAGCQSLAAAPSQAPSHAQAASGKSGTPARLQAPSEACLTAIAAFASSTTGRQVHLTPLAFKDSPLLLLERAAHKDQQGRLLDGMSLDRPETFELTQSPAGPCVVTHGATAKSLPIPDCNCQAHSGTP